LPIPLVLDPASCTEYVDPGFNRVSVTLVILGFIIVTLKAKVPFSKYTLIIQVERGVVVVKSRTRGFVKKYLLSVINH